MGNFGTLFDSTIVESNAAETTVGSEVAWVRFPGMPIQYYNKSVLRAISGVVGNFMWVDYNTGEAQRGRFARVAVEIYLSKPLISHFTIEIVFREWNMRICL